MLTCYWLCVLKKHSNLVTSMDTATLCPMSSIRDGRTLLAKRRDCDTLLAGIRDHNTLLAGMKDCHTSLVGMREANTALAGMRDAQSLLACMRSGPTSLAVCVCCRCVARAVCGSWWTCWITGWWRCRGAPAERSGTWCSGRPPMTTKCLSGMPEGSQHS